MMLQVPVKLLEEEVGFKHTIPPALWGKVLGSSQESARALGGVSRDSNTADLEMPKELSR